MSERTFETTDLAGQPVTISPAQTIARAMQAHGHIAGVTDIEALALMVSCLERQRDQARAAETAARKQLQASKMVFHVNDETGEDERVSVRVGYTGTVKMRTDDALEFALPCEAGHIALPDDAPFVVLQRPREGYELVELPIPRPLGAMDGQYKGDGRSVVKSPTQTETGFKMGYVVCEVASHMTDNTSAAIAEALNQHMLRYPEKHGVEGETDAQDTDDIPQEPSEQS